MIKTTITFLNMDHTEALDQRIRSKTDKIEKYLTTGTHVKWTCFVKKNVHYAELQVNGVKQQFHAKAAANNLYKTFDLVISKMEKQLNKLKDKKKNKIHREKTELVILDPVNAWDDYDDDIKIAA